jgi:transketolase
MRAKVLLEKEGLSVGLVNMRSLKPVDEEAIVRVARASRLLVTIEDHLQTGGLYSIVAETLLRHWTMGTEVLPLALDERWFRPGLLAEVLDTEGFTPEKIAARITQNIHVYAK